MMKSKNTFNVFLLLLLAHFTRLAQASIKLDSWIVTHPADYDFTKVVPEIDNRTAESIFDASSQSLTISQMLLTNDEASRLKSSFGNLRGGVRGFVEKDEYIYADDPISDSSVGSATPSNNVLSSFPTQCDTPVENYALFVIDGKIDTNSSYFKRNFGSYPVIMGPDYSPKNGITQHGFYVAWIISQIIRMGNNAAIHGVTVFDSTNRATYASIITAFQYVMSQIASLNKRGISVGINASLNGPFLQALNTVVAEAAKRSDVTVSAGNKAVECSESPANTPNIDAICALDTNGQPASYTNWGCSDQMLCALGSIRIPAYFYPNLYTTFTGTSGSSPLIAAVKAARKSNRPNSTPADISASLHADAQQIIPDASSHVKRPVYAIPVDRLCPVDTRLFNKPYVSSKGSFSPIYRPLTNKNFGIRFSVKYSNARPNLRLDNTSSLTIDVNGNNIFKQILDLNGTQTVSKGRRLVAIGKTAEFVLTATNQDRNNTIDLYYVDSKKKLHNILHAFTKSKIETVAFGARGTGTVTYPVARKYVLV